MPSRDPVRCYLDMHTPAGRDNKEPARPGVETKAADGDPAIVIGRESSAAADMMSVERWARVHD